MFTIIVFLIEEKNKLQEKKVFSRLSSLIEKQKKIELIFVVDDKSYSWISLVENFQNKNPNLIVKLVFSSKKISFNNLLENATKLITNDYVLFFHPSSSFEDDFLESVSRVINKNPNLDIIEFKTKISGILKWKANNRLTKNKVDKLLKISENPEVIAFSFPFIYNKAVSTNLLVKSIKNFWKEFNEDFSTLLFSRFIYLIFLNAKNYYYDSKLLVELNISDELIPNYKNVINCWILIEDIFIQENKFVEEIRYAKLFYLKIILCSLYSMQGMIKVKKIINNHKNNLLQKKYYEKLSKIEDQEFKHFVIKNKYMLQKQNLVEINLLKQHHPISKWSKLIKELKN